MKLSTSHQQFIKFCLIGVCTSSLDFIILNLLHGILGVNLIIANTVSTTMAIIINYYLNRKWTFQSIDPNKQTKQFIKFFIVSLIGLILNDIILYALSNNFSINYNLGKLIATCIIVFWNFSANKYWTFKQSPKAI